MFRSVWVELLLGILGLRLEINRLMSYEQNSDSARNLSSMYLILIKYLTQFKLLCNILLFICIDSLCTIVVLYKF